MSKLTSEWCRNHIESMKANGLSLLEEKYLEALEIALPILEKQERDEGEWVEWKGGFCPVRGETIVDVKWSNGDKNVGKEADEWRWQHWDNCPNIIAYRIIPERANIRNMYRRW